MRKPTSINFEIDHLQILKQYLIPPVSMSDLINDIAGYMIQNPSVINTFVERKLNELKQYAMTNVNNT